MPDSNLKNNQSGFAALYLTLLILTASLALAASIFILNLTQQKDTQNIVKSSQAYYMAEAGIEDAILRIKNSMPISSDYVLMVDFGQTAVSIDSPNPNTRIIRATGTKGNVSKILEAQLSIQSVNPEFFYGAQAGSLGIVMENNTRIEGAGGVSGNVYSNGSISGDNGATITGTVFIATGMTEDQSYGIYNSDQIFGKDNPIIDIAQSFQSLAANTLVKISVYIKKVGNPDDINVRILTDNSGSPSETTLASATLHKNLVGTAFGWVDVVFSSPANLTQGQTYWLLMNVSRDSNDYWVWGKDQNQGYVQGQAKYSQDWNDDPWISLTGDMNFKTFMGGLATFLDNVNVSGDAHANTITDSDITGNAYYQAISGSTVGGTGYPGSSDPPLQNMPISDSNINQWKDDATAGGILNGNLTVSSNLSYGPKKINGNLIITSNNKILTVTGIIYVTGYIDIDNGSAIRCDVSYGLNSCVVVADKWVHISNNGIFQGSGQAGSYIMVLSTSNCDGTFSTDCTHHNGAMDIHNGVTGAVFYANDGLIHLHNGVTVSELVAKKIQLEQGAIIRYEQGLAIAGFSSGPGGSWKVVSWKEVE